MRCLNLKFGAKKVKTPTARWTGPKEKVGRVVRLQEGDSIPEGVSTMAFNSYRILSPGLTGQSVVSILSRLLHRVPSSYLMIVRSSCEVDL